MNPIYVVIYVMVAVLVGLCGRLRRMGFLGSFLLALVVSPPLALLFLYLTTEVHPLPPAGRRCC